MKGTGERARRSVLRKGGRLAALVGTVLAGVVAVMLATTLVAAADAGFGTSEQYFGGDGMISIGTTCSHDSHSAGVGVAVQNPSSYPDGLWFYMQVFAKAHSASWSQATLLAQTQKFVDTITAVPIPIWGGYSYVNNVVNVLSTSFTGSSWGYYDVEVKYWTAVPGGSWSAPSWLVEQWFTEATGGMRVQSGTCML